MFVCCVVFDMRCLLFVVWCLVRVGSSVCVVCNWLLIFSKKNMLRVVCVWLAACVLMVAGCLVVAG